MLNERPAPTLSRPLVNQADLVIYQGDDYASVVTVYDANDREADVSGHEAYAQLRRQPAETGAPLEVRITTAVQSPDIMLSIPRDITSTLSGWYVWDLRLIDVNGVVTTILAGKASIQRDVTRETVFHAY